MTSLHHAFAKSKLLWLLSAMVFKLSFVSGQFIDTSVNRVKTPLRVGMPCIGTIRPRSTKQIAASYITVGCETLDRNLAVWNNYKNYLPPLGVKKIRLQAGWARCESVKGVYNWQWLDSIINFAMDNGIQPWLQTSYGNPVYPGGGGTGLLNSLMKSDEAYAAWDRWVNALVTRYKDRVKEWEIWNEPDHPMQNNSPELIAELNMRTAEIIKKIQPDAHIAGLAFASNRNTEYLDKFLKAIADKGKLSLFEWISYHSYDARPEDAYSMEKVFALQKVMAKYSSTLKLRQGENGAPSTYIPSFALSNLYWTEYTQAKYNLRRLLGDLGHNIETSVFTIIDIWYRPVLNTKGLIQSDTTMMAVRAKVAYYAVQNLAAVFDADLVLDQSQNISNMGGHHLSVYGFRQKKTGLPVLAFWLDSAGVSNSFTTKPETLTVENCTFKKPVWVDLLSGRVYRIPLNQWHKKGTMVSISVPAYDSPVLLTDEAAIKIQRKPGRYE